MKFFDFWSGAASKDLEFLEDPQPQQVADLFL